MTEPTGKPMPGPWFVDPFDPLRILAPDGDRDPWVVAEVASDCGGVGDNDNSVANARLIADAWTIPALREVLEKARIRFLEYEVAHAAKGTADGDAKAIRNAEMAETIRVALALGQDQGGET